MQAYFDGAIPQLIARAEALERAIRSDLPPDYHALATLCRTALTEITGQLMRLRDDPIFADGSVQAERLRAFRRCRKAITQLESRAIATLDREKREDLGLNALVRRIVGEIRHTPLPPIVSPLSQMYFSIDTSLNILFVPLVENRFLLHLPDVYHELGHQCFTEQASPRLRPLAGALLGGATSWLDACETEKQRLSRSRGPKARRDHVALAQRCSSTWVIELYCDLYAVFTAGPAYGWSHLHLAALFGDTPFAEPASAATTHPADDARMQVILRGLRVSGYETEAADIERHWSEFKAAGRYTASPEYPLYYPDQVLTELPESAFRAFDDADVCGYHDAPSDSVARILNQAWQRFWRSPHDYLDWEQRAVTSLLSK